MVCSLYSRFKTVYCIVYIAHYAYMFGLCYVLLAKKKSYMYSISYIRCMLMEYHTECTLNFILDCTLSITFYFPDTAVLHRMSYNTIVHAPIL